MVIGDNPEDQLAPYDENIRTAPRISGEVSEEEKQRMIDYYKETDGIVFLTFDKLYEEKGKQWNDNSWIKEDGKWVEYTTYNPDSKWDWYQLGGRWTGFLKLKKGKKGDVGTHSLVSERRAETGYVDAALKKDIDFNFMKNKAKRDGIKRYDKVMNLIGHTEPNKPWSYFVEKMEKKELTINEGREQYHAQPRLVEVKKHTGELGFLFDADKFLVAKEKYVEDKKNSAVSTFAVVKDGVWYERGKMGWWAVVHDEKEQDVWNEKVNELINSIDGDTLISIYDCHI
jgi:hypothetical protein